MNGKEFKEFLNKKVKQENIGRAAGITQDAEKIYNGLQSQYNDFVKQTKSGKTLSQQDLRIYRLALDDLQKLTPLTGFDTATKKQLNQINQNLKNGTDILQNYNKNALAREEAYRKLDDVKKKQTGNFLFGLESENDKTAAERAQLKKQSIALKDEIAKYDAAIAPYLDVKATKKQLDNTSFFDFKAHDRAKTDYQNAREMKTGREAEEWLQEKEVKQLSVQAGTAAAAQETIDSSGNKANLKAAKEARYFSQYKDKLKSTIKGRGYKDSDDELDKLVDEIVRRGKMDVTEKQQIDINKKLQEYTKVHPVIGSFAAAAAGTVAKVPGAKYALSQAIKGFISDERVYNDPNSAYFFGSNAYNQVTTAVKDEIAKHIENKYDDPEVIKSKIKDAQMMYDGAMSGLENIIRAVTTAGVGEAYALVPMALAQLSDIALQKTIEGYSPTDAGYYAFIGAVAEYATEKMGIDALFSKVPGGRNVIVGYLSKLLKVGAAEGAEEVVSDVINDAADCLYEFLSDKKSVREKEISHLMREGMSYKEAAEAYTHNKINEYIDDAVMGATVGALLGGGSTAVNISAKTANIARNLSASKQQAQAANQQTINAIQEEFGGRLTVEAAADVAKERGQWIDGNAYYENLIEQAKNSYDPKVAQMGIDAEDDYRYQKQMKDGRVSIAKAGRLINHISAANIRATTGMATQMLESVGAKSATVKAVVNAIEGEELSRRDIKNIKNSPDALSMLSQLYQDNTGEAIFLSAESDNDTIREVAGAVQGATFNIDRNTDAGKLYSTAARMRADGDIGFNGMKGFLSGYRENLNMSLEEYTNVFKLAYNEAKAGKSPEAIAEHVHSLFAASEADEATTAARDAAVLRATLTAQNDIEHENKQAKKEKKEAKQEAEEDVTDNLHSKSGLEEDTSEADPVTKKAVESAKKLSRLSESEKAEKYKNGGAIVETRQELTTQQSAIISFYDYRGKKHGITYRFVDAIESNAGARGEYNHQTEVITIRIGEVADMTATAGHELGHWLKAHYPEEYAKMQQYLKDTVFKTNYEAKVAAKIAAYKKADITIDEEAAFEELTNDCLFGVDMASSEYEEFVRANETLMQKAFRVIRELLEDLQHFMEDWRKQLPGMYKQVTEIKMVQELYDDVEFMEYTADWVDGILNRSTASEQSAASEQTTDAGEQKNSTTAESGVRYSFVDKTDDGRSIYKTNYPKGTPKIKKQNDVINLVQNIWSKKPIALKIIENGKWKTINARFNPEFSSRSDLTKIAFGNRKGSASEQRMTLDLAGDLYLIAEESKYVKSKGETGKDFNRAHDNVDVWHYFVTNLVYRDENDNDIDCHMNIDVKHNNNGNWFYSFAIEKGTAPQTLLAVVTDESATVPTNSISDNSEKSNSSFQVSDADYLEATRNGDEEKASKYVEQAAERAFSNSTVRDDNGKLLKLYHGTPNAGFTVFKPESYFTPNKEYADVYQSPGASSNSVKTSADNPSTYAVYLNIEKPFDTRNAKERDIFYNEFYRQWGNGAPLAESGLPDWTDASDLLEFIEEKGYDYDGIILDEGGTGGYGDEVKSRGLSYVPVNANQIKSADPITYDDNGEIIPLSERFSESKDIRFQVADTVEETKDLVAVHNLSEEKLMKSLKLGGMPMPSIAISRAKYGHNEFGDISLVFPKSTIDPQKNNEVWSGDAYTPTYPQIDYKINKKVVERAYNKVEGLLDEKGYTLNDFDHLQIDSDIIADRVKYGELVRYYEEKTGMMAAYLIDKGVHFEPVMQEKTLSDFGRVKNEAVVRFANELGKEKVYEAVNGPSTELDKLKPAVISFLNKDAESKLSGENLKKIKKKPFYNEENVGFSTVNELVSAAFTYFHQGGIKSEVNTQATKNILKELITDKDDFKKWISSLFDGVVEKEGIRNNRDYYTPAGYRRSFEELHYEHTLENVVRAMKEKGKQGIGAFGGSNIFGASKVSYDSIADIKANSDKLVDASDEKAKKEYEEKRQELSDRFLELCSSLPNNNSFSATDCAAEVLTESVVNFSTRTGMDNYIRRELNGWATYRPSIVDDLMDIVNDIRALPAAYFEAKPQRGVSFNEVYTAVIPDNASADLKAALDKAGVKYQTYEAGNDKDRVRVINSLDEVKFQISDTTLTPEQQAAIERKAMRREMAKLELENENLKAALDAALKQTKLSKDFRHDASKTAQIAKKLLRKFGVRDVEEGDYRFNRFVDALNKFYDTIDDSKLEGTGGSDVTYMAALEAIESVRDSLEETDYTNADYLRDFLSDIGTPDSQGRIRYIYLNEDAARSVLENYGSFRNVISHTGNIHFKALQPGESHATLDEIWESEIAGKWGDVVTGASEMSTDGLINLTDSTMQAQVLINAIENARDVVQGRNTYNPLGDKTAFEAADEIIDGEVTSDESYIINEMIMELYESYNDAEWQATFADKKANKERVKYLQYKSKLRQSMDRYRRQVNERNETYRKKIEKNYQERYNKAISRNDLRVQMEKERLANYKERVAESRKKATERKKQTEIKNKIRKMALELARLGGDPNKKKHLPNGLVKVTKEFLELIDTGDRNNGKLSQYVYNINTEFARIEGHPGYDALSDSYNNMIKGQIEEIAVEIGHKNLNELTSSELQKVWECAKTIKHSVVHMNRFFLAEKNATPEQYQQKLLQERKGKDSKKELVAAMGLKRFIDNDLKPYYFFNKLQSPTMNKLYDALRTGQDTWANDIQEGEKAITSIKEKYNYSAWDQRKKYEFKLESGQTVSLNLQQIMSLRAYADREASYGHIYIGGIKLLSGTEATRHLKDKVTQRLDNTRYEISPADLEKITRTLSKEQTAYVIAMRDYLSSLSEKGNQVSRALFDLELFKEINYFPMRSSQEYTRQGEFKETGEKKLKNWGNAKPLVPGADNPLVIEEFNDVWSRHVNEMALYHAFTLPLEDFQKVYGYYKVVKPAEEKEMRKNFSDEKAFEEHMPTTASIRNLFSVSEQQYISQFLRNLNGGVKKADNTLGGRGIAKYKKMSTALNLRVAVQQPGAIARAFLYINPKYFAKTAGKGFTGFKSDSKTVQEMEKYSGAAFIKSMGYFDVDTGKTAEEFLLESGDNYKGAQKVKGFFFDGKYRDSLLLMGPEVMDRITWVQIWEATKAKVAAEEGLTGKALLKRTGKVFSDVVDKTQVYDSVFTRSGHMRSTDALAKMATSFMAEPTTTINMIYDAVTQCRAGKVNKKFVAGAFASCFTATLFTNLLASVVSAMRHGKKDDNWWELWTGEFTADALNDIILLNSLPIVRDIYNLAKGFDIERADMTLFSDWVSSVQKLNEASQKGKLTYKEWINFMSSSAVMLGLPLKSLYKDINGIFTAYQIVTNGTSPTREGIRKAIKKGTLDTLVADDFLPIAQPSTNKYDTIYLLYAGGNKKEAEKRKKILFKYDEEATQDKLDAYIAGQLLFNKSVISAASALMKGDMSKTKSEMAKVKNFDKALVLKAMVKMLNEQVDEDAKVTETSLIKGSTKKTLEQNLLLNNPTVRKAAIALNKNDDEARYNLQKQLVSEGFSVNDVIKATRTVKGKMFPSEKKDDTSEKEMKYFQYADVANALKANNVSFAKKVMNRLIEDYKKEGKSTEDVKKQVRAKITSAFKEEYYMASESRRAAIRVLMWKTGAYDSGDAVLKVCNGWVKQIAKKKFG